MRRLPAILTTLLAAGTAQAEVPTVLADTAPIHSLVAQVMHGVGTPDLLMPPGISPHDFQFRPSDAAKLSDAQVVIWAGHGLTPWLEEPLDTLATQAITLELLDSPGWTPLPLREDAAFAAAEEHEEEGHDHEHGDTDPHAWLSPDVAAVWISQIAETLAAADPENSEAYRANGVAALDRLTELKREVTAELAPVQGRAYIVPHDAYQYFETAFSMPAAGAVTLSDASSPGPARVGELRDMVAAGNVACILTDAETSPEWSAVIAEGSLAKTAQADPDGISYTPGPELYGQIIHGLADALVECLS